MFNVLSLITVVLVYKKAECNFYTFHNHTTKLQGFMRGEVMQENMLMLSVAACN